MGTKAPSDILGPSLGGPILQNSPNSKTQWGFLPKPRVAILKMGSPGHGVEIQNLRLFLRLAESETLGVSGEVVHVHGLGNPILFDP